MNSVGVLVKTTDLTNWCRFSSSCEGVDAYPNTATFEIAYTDGSKQAFSKELSSVVDIPWTFGKRISTMTYTIALTGSVTTTEPMLVEEFFAWKGFNLNSKITSITQCNVADCSFLSDTEFLVRSDFSYMYCLEID